MYMLYKLLRKSGIRISGQFLSVITWEEDRRSTLPAVSKEDAKTYESIHNY